MRRSTEVLIALVALIALPSAALIYRFAKLPVQPRHPAMARVAVISQHDGKFSAGWDYIVVRNARGTGQFSMLDSDVRCRVGDEVPVEQQGITLTRVARTCR